MAISHLTIHIGDPKTGTTSIQSALQNDLIDCSSRSIARWHQSNAVKLARTLHSAKRPKQRNRRFAEVATWLEASEADEAIISSEYFSRANPKALHRMLSKHVPSHLPNVRIVGYVRPHVSRVLAAYIQRTKSGGITTDFESFLNVVGKSMHVDFTRRFLSWREHFGDQFTLRPFIRSELRDQDVVADFFGIVLGDAPFSVTKVVEENTSVTLRALSGLNLLHGRLKKVGGSKMPLGQIGGTIANVYLARGKMVGSMPKLDRASVQKLVDVCHEDARTLDAAFFDKPLMQEALQSSLDKAGDTPMDLTHKNHFNSAECRNLIKLSNRIANLLLQNPQPWKQHDRAQRKQIVLNEDDKQSLAQHRASIDEINSHMVDISEILRG